MADQQQPPQFQPQPPQQYQQQAPMGMLHLTIQGNALTSLVPTVLLNGHRVRVKFGRNDIPVFAGPLHVDMHCQGMLRFGMAALDCMVQPNQAVPVFYASPISQFISTGSIGHSKVKRYGPFYFVGMAAGFVFVVGAVLILLRAPN